MSENSYQKGRYDGVHAGLQKARIACIEQSKKHRSSAEQCADAADKVGCLHAAIAAMDCALAIKELME